MHLIRKIVCSVGSTVAISCFCTGCAITDTTPATEGATTVPVVEKYVSKAPPNTIVEKDGIITISVYIDRNTLKSKRADLEATAMLRTDRLLRKTFQDLPKNYTVQSSVDKAELDGDTGIYTYVTKTTRVAVDEAITAGKK